MNYLQGNKFNILNPRGNIVGPSYKKIIPGKGMKREDQTGDLVITFQIQFPTTLSEETITTLETLI